MDTISEEKNLESRSHVRNISGILSCSNLPRSPKKVHVVFAETVGTGLVSPVKTPIVSPIRGSNPILMRIQELQSRVAACVPETRGRGYSCPVNVEVTENASKNLTQVHQVLDLENTNRELLSVLKETESKICSLAKEASEAVVKNKTLQIQLQSSTAEILDLEETLKATQSTLNDKVLQTVHLSIQLDDCNEELESYRTAAVSQDPAAMGRVYTNAYKSREIVQLKMQIESLNADIDNIKRNKEEEIGDMFAIMQENLKSFQEKAKSDATRIAELEKEISLLKTKPEIFSEELKFISNPPKLNVSKTHRRSYTEFSPTNFSYTLGSPKIRKPFTNITNLI